MTPKDASRSASKTVRRWRLHLALVRHLVPCRSLVGFMRSTPEGWLHVARRTK